MAKLHSINIRNFRGFSEFYYQFAGANFIALIGRGDSGKTTILEAISFVLSPNWTIPLCDTDYQNLSRLLQPYMTCQKNLSKSLNSDCI